MAVTEKVTGPAAPSMTVPPPIAPDVMVGEVSVTVWPKQLKDICAKKNIHVLE